MKKILVPTDFSPCANNAVDFAVQLAKILPFEVTLLHVFELVGDIYTDYMGVNKEFNQSLLDGVQHKLTLIKSSIQEREGVSVNTNVYKGSVKETVLKTVKEGNFDLLVMGTSGARGIKEKLWGSETASIIGKSPVPVMAIPVEYKWKKPDKILLAINHFESETSSLDFLFEMTELFLAKVQVTVFTNEAHDKAATFLEHSRKIPQYEKTLKEQYKQTMLSVAHLYGTNFEKTLQDYIGQNEIDILAMVTYKRKFPDNIFHPSMTKQMAYHTKIPLLALPAK